MENNNLVGFLAGLGRTSLQAGVLVVVIVAVQWLFRGQLAPRWRCACWLLVVARLLLPVSFGSAASIFNLLPRWNDQVERFPQAAQASLVVEPEIPVARAIAAAPGVLEQVPEQPPEAKPIRLQDRAASAVVPSAVKPAPSAHAHPEIGRRFSWAGLLFWVWLAGAAVLTGYTLISSVRLSHRFSGLEPSDNPAVLAVLAECRAGMNVRSPLTLVESGAVGCPALCGLFRPRLVLPLGFAARFSERELRFIFLHELAHLKRLDLPMNWLIAALQIAHWFNPLVWLGFARWRLDRELACDELALDAAGANQNHEYGRTILRLLEGFTRPTPTPGLLGILETKRQLRQRILMIAAHVPAPRWPLLAALVLVGLGVVGLTDARNSSANPSAARNDLPSTQAFEAQHAAPAPQPRPVVTNGPALKVTVLDHETGSPLAGAEVLAPHHAAFQDGVENAPVWTTDDSGLVTIRLGEIPSEPTRQTTFFSISVRRPGYAPRGLTWSAEKGDARPRMPGKITAELRPGLTIGGTVTDPSGAPQARAQVRAFGWGYRVDSSQGPHQEYPEYWTSKDGVGRVTDPQGAWHLEDFPGDLENVTVVVTRPDGSTRTFRHCAPSQIPLHLEVGEPLDLAALRAAKLVLVLQPGFSVQGTVVDPDGRPVPGAWVKEGYGFGNQRRGVEIHTDPAGRFAFANREPRQMILTAYAQDFAITSTIVDIGSDTSPVRLQLGRLRPLPIRVLDRQGNPIAGAQIRVRADGQVLDLGATTDQKGLFVWSNAPHSAFDLIASTPRTTTRGDFDLEQVITVKPEQTSVIFRLREGTEKEVIVRGSARDAQTGSSVMVKRVSLQGLERQDFSSLTDVKASEFELRIPASEFPMGFKLKLEADGHETLITPWRNFGAGDWEEEFVLTPGRNPGGTLLLPDGEPAAAAQVAVQARECFPVDIYIPRTIIGGSAKVVRADERGHFEFDFTDGDWAVVVLHEKGFMATTADRLKTQPRLTLQPWGRVEGVLRVGTNTAPREPITLTDGDSSGFGNGWHFSVDAKTDDQGRFAFDYVPPGESLLFRYTGRESSLRSPALVHQTPIEVKPGEVTRVAYGGTGRPVTGRIEGKWDYSHDAQLLALKLPPVASHPRTDDYATSGAFAKARDRYYATERPREQRAERNYPLRFSPDGTFRIDDVPAGLYELRIRVTGPAQRLARSPSEPSEQEIAVLNRDVVVPEMAGGRSNEPLDLGILRLQTRDE